MKLKPTTFLAIYKDGLVLTAGHEFSVDGRLLVVHKTRPALLPVDKFYKISEATAGFSVPIEKTKIRATAVQFATDAMHNITDESWQREIARHLELAQLLKIVKG